MKDLFIWIGECGGLLALGGAGLAVLSVLLILLSIGVVPQRIKLTRRFDPLVATRVAFVSLLSGALLLATGESQCRPTPPGEQARPSEGFRAMTLHSDDCPEKDGKFCHMGGPPDGHKSVGTWKAVDNHLRAKARDWILRRANQRLDRPPVDVVPSFSFKVISAQVTSPDSSVRVLAYAELDIETIDKAIDDLILSTSGTPVKSSTDRSRATISGGLIRDEAQIEQ